MSEAQGHQEQGLPSPVAPDRLQQLLIEAASLTGSEARTIVTLLHLRTATLKQLGEATGISASNLSPVLQALASKGVCRRVPGRARYSIWECPEPSEVLARLRGWDEARRSAAMQEAASRFEEVGEMLARYEPVANRSARHAEVMDVAHSIVLYQEAIESVDTEILVLNRGPYIGELAPDPGVAEALDRGASARAIFQRDELEDPNGALRRLADAYARVGVQQRVAERVPTAAAVLGREFVLVTVPNGGMMTEPEEAIAVRSEEIAELLTAAFEHLWQGATPYELSEQPDDAATATAPTPLIPKTSRRTR